MAATSAGVQVFTLSPARAHTWMTSPVTACPANGGASDAELVALIRRGKTEGIAQLVDRYSPRLYRYLRRLVGEPALAEDILQDTWLRVVERLDRYDAQQPFAGWLFAIARHRAIDTLRQRARESHSFGSLAEGRENDAGERLDPLEWVAAQTPSPLDELATADLERRVAEVFTRLPRHYREVLTLRFHEGLRLEEIARLLDLPLSTVKSRVQRGLVMLRQRAEGLGLKPNE